MLVKTVVGAAVDGYKTENLQIEKSISHLMIKRVGAAASDFTTERINVYLQSRTGQTICIPNLLIKDLSEIGQFGEGANYKTAAGVSKRSIGIGVGAGFDLRDNEILYVEMSGLVEAAVYTIYGIEGAGTRQMYIYNHDTMKAGSTVKEIDTRAVHLFAVEVADLDTLTLNFGNYSTNSTVEELEFKTRSANDIALVGSASTDIVAAREGFFIQHMFGCQTAQFRSNGNEVVFYTVNVKAIA